MRMKTVQTVRWLNGGEDVDEPDDGVAEWGSSWC